MQKITADSPEAKSADIVAENIARLKALFPEAFAEDGINFEVLKQLLGGAVNEKEEKYSFTWPGKRQARQIALTPSLGTLRPAPEESVNWDTTQNLFIEGDNLEVLKLLQKSYSGKVKMIYIDPPYNTGNDFIYFDDYKDNIKNFKIISKLIDDDGEKITSDQQISGRYHSNWLSMMYPRLRMARNLLKNDGVIFTSIDDKELINLRRLYDEIFGEENFLGTIVWNNATDNNPTNIAIEHEYIISYAKSKEYIASEWKSEYHAAKNAILKIENELLAKFDDTDSVQKEYSHWFRENKKFLWPLDRYKYIDRGGVYIGSQSVHNPGREGYRYDVIHPITKKPCKEPLLGYRFPPETMNQLLADNKILFGEDENKIIELKLYAKDYRSKLSSVIELDGRAGPYDLKAIFPESIKAFDTPKPKDLLRELINFSTNTSDYVLDFFSGACTTAHSVFDLNTQDFGNRHFIMVQLPESTGASQYPTIAEIGKERIRRAIKKIKAEHPDYTGDLGFRVFKLDSSNIRPWNPDANDVAGSLLAYTDNLLPDRTEQDLLYEVLLKFGLDLTSPMQERAFAGHTIYSMGQGVLFACLSKAIAQADIEPIGLGIADWRKEANPVGESTVIFRDSAFAGDVAKANMTAILQQHGIDNVRSL